MKLINKLALLFVCTLSLLSGVLLLSNIPAGGGILEPDNSQEEIVTPPNDNADAIGDVSVYSLLEDYNNSSNCVAGFGASGCGQVASQNNFNNITWSYENTTNWWGNPYVYAKPNTGFHLKSIRQTGATLSSSTAYTNYTSRWTTSYNLTTDNGVYRTVDKVGATTAQYVAIFARNKAILYYTPNGGNGSTVTQTVYYGISATLKPSSTFSRTGYTFSQWGDYNDNDDDYYGYYNAGISVPSALGPSTTPNVYSSQVSSTLHAIWRANTYSISYNLDGGTHGSTHPTSATYDQAFYLSTPSKTGYTFAGWTFSGNTSYAKYGTSASSCNTSWSSTSTKVKSTYFKNLVTSGSVTLTANWTANTYDVILDTNASSGITNSGTKSVKATYDQHLPSITIPAREGYTFNGYYEYTNGGKPYYDSTGTSTYVYTDTYDYARTLYADWIPITYNISYNLNNGTHGSNHPTSATYETAFQLSNPTKTGYTFAGWTFNGNTGTAKYGTTSSTTNSWSSTSTKVTATYFKNLSTRSSESVTLTANWTARTYTVTLNPNGGNGGQTSVTATYDSAMPALSSLPSKSGWAFQGYYDAETGGTQYYTAEGASARAWNKTTTNPTLYAHWQEKTWIEDASYYSTSLSGQGTAASPYLITSAKDLAYLAKQSQTNTFAGKYFKQTADIDINAHLWQPIASNSKYPFAGNYNGGLYRIENPRVQVETPAGIFGYLSGTVENVHLYGGKIACSTSYSGGIAGQNAGIITKCIVDSVNVVVGQSYAGGITGDNNSSGIIEQCAVVNCSISSTYGAAGIAGYNSGRITNSFANNVSTYVFNNLGAYGTLVASNSGTIESSYGNVQIKFGSTSTSATKVMYGNSSAWTNWSLVPNVNGGLPVQKGLYHIGGFTSAQQVYNYLTTQGYTVQS